MEGVEVASHYVLLGRGRHEIDSIRTLLGKIRCAAIAWKESRRFAPPENEPPSADVI